MNGGGGFFRDRFYDWLGAKPRPWVGKVLLVGAVVVAVVLMLALFVFRPAHARWG